MVPVTAPLTENLNMNKHTTGSTGNSGKKTAHPIPVLDGLVLAWCLLTAAYSVGKHDKLKQKDSTIDVAEKSRET